MPAINALRNPTQAGETDARVLPLKHGPGVDVLPEGDLERIHAAVLRVLEDTGVGIGSPGIAERLGAAGAQMETETDRVRFPATLVHETLRPGKRELLLAARDPACDLPVNGTEAWLSTGGTAAEVVDLETGERRGSTRADVVSVSRLADALPQIGFAGPSVSALDVPPGSRALHELHDQVANTSKHVQMEITVDAAGAEALLEIARAVSGGEAELRERPAVSAYLPIRSPLDLDGDALEAAVTLAGAGIPCGFVAAPVAGRSAPASIAGALVIAAAEALAGVVALRLLVPDAPTFFGTSALQVRQAEEPTPGGPQDTLFQMAWVQLASRFGLRAHVGAFATGARSSDWQAGMEGGLWGTACWMAAPDLLAAAGLRDGGRVFSPVAMLLDTELFDLIRRVPLGFEVDEETLALDVIEEVGPGEHFLGEQHTLRHMREAWMSRFMDKDTWEAWEEKGRPGPPDHAADHARELLASHEPTPLPPAAEERIREVIAEHERDRR